MAIRVEIGDAELRRWLDQVGDGALGRVRTSIEGSVGKIVERAEKRWPIGRRRQGAADGQGREHSRDLFRIETRITDDYIEVVVSNDAKDAKGRPYAYMIKSFQYGYNGKNAWNEMLKKPIINESKRLAESLQADLNKLSGGGR